MTTTSAASGLSVTKFLDPMPIPPVITVPPAHVATQPRQINYGDGPTPVGGLTRRSKNGKISFT